jgi:glycosyltransferase involved in cell wall biosynthesis
LASLQETFGKVYVEAGLAGLPIFVHDFSTSREVLKEFAFYGNLSHKGILKELLADYKSKKIIKFDSKDMVFYLEKNFAWKNIKDRYIEMLKIQELSI